MTHDLTRAVRERVGLLIGFAGTTGSGKTYSAMELAQGIVGRDNAFAVIDSEARRALHYAPAAGEEPNFKTTFRFDHLDLRPPFSSEVYADVIAAVSAKGYGAIVIDNFSDEHEGEGGLLDYQAQELEERVKRTMDRRSDAKEWEVRDALTRSSWIKPKAAHKKMVLRFGQVRSHLIFCLRAEDKIDFKKGTDGKTRVVPMKTLAGFKGWIPICDKRFPFIFTASFIMTPDRPGVPQPIKLQEQHRPFFPEGKPVTEECGARLAAWAAGGAAPTFATGLATFTARITAAPDTATLAAIGAEITAAKGQLSAGDETALREAFRTRREQLAGQKEATA